MTDKTKAKTIEELAYETTETIRKAALAYKEGDDACLSTLHFWNKMESVIEDTLRKSQTMLMEVDLPEPCSVEGCTFHRPICEKHVAEQAAAYRAGMPQSGRKA